MEEMMIKISTMRLKGSDLIVAFSDDLRGFNVHGRSMEEIESRLPNALKEFLEASGNRVNSVELLEDSVPPGFESPKFIANAHLMAA